MEQRDSVFFYSSRHRFIISLANRLGWKSERHLFLLASEPSSFPGTALEPSALAPARRRPVEKPELALIDGIDVLRNVLVRNPRQIGGPQPRSVDLEYRLGESRFMEPAAKMYP